MNISSFILTLFHSSNEIALIPDIDRVNMFEDCFSIDAGRFSIMLGLDSLILSFTEITGIGFIITFEFFLIGIADSYLNTIDVRGPAGINFEAFTISGGFVEFAFSLNLCNKFFNALSFLIFSFKLSISYLFLFASSSAFFFFNFPFRAFCETKEWSRLSQIWLKDLLWWSSCDLSWLSSCSPWDEDY